MDEGIPQTYINTSFVVGYFALNSVLLVEVSTLRDLGIIVVITRIPNYRVAEPSYQFSTLLGGGAS
jgi:hypothetical protein